MPPLVIAAAFMALSALVQVLDSVIVRYLAQDIHPFEILFFRNLFSLLVLAPLMTPADRTLSGKGLWVAHGSRAVLKLAAMTSAFFAISLLPLSVFTAIAFTTPLFATLGAILFIREPVRPSRLFALCLGFAGIVVVLRPEQVPIGAGAVLALVGAIGLAAVVLVLKFTSGREFGLPHRLAEPADLGAAWHRDVGAGLVDALADGVRTDVSAGRGRARRPARRHQRDEPSRRLAVGRHRLHPSPAGGCPRLRPLRRTGGICGPCRRSDYPVVARRSVFARGPRLTRPRIILTFDRTNILVHHMVAT